MHPKSQNFYPSCDKALRLVSTYGFLPLKGMTAYNLLANNSLPGMYFFSFMLSFLLALRCWVPKALVLSLRRVTNKRTLWMRPVRSSPNHSSLTKIFLVCQSRVSWFFIGFGVDLGFSLFCTLTRPFHMGENYYLTLLGETNISIFLFIY